MSRQFFQIKNAKPVNYNENKVNNKSSENIIQRKTDDHFSWMNVNTEIQNRINQNIFQPGKQNVVQPKLEISKPGDYYEREADTMAEKVMSTNNFSFIKTEKNQNKNSISPFSNSGTTANSQLEQELQDSNSNGNSLSNDVRTFMESRFGTDFSNVKIHTDSNAVHMNRMLNSHAFTHGNNIYFNSGKYNPESNSGKNLLAHELTHVVQQSSNSAPSIQRDGENNDAFSFNFDLLPPALKFRLGSFMLNVNTSSSEFNFTQGLMRTTLGYSYGSDIYLGSSGGGFNSRIGFNPSSDQISLGLGYDQFRLNTSFNPSTTSFGLGLGYGSSLLPMPSELSSSVYRGEAGAESALGSLGSMSNPYSWYTQNGDNIDAIMSAVKSTTSIGDAQEGSFGAGLRFTYNPQSGAIIYGGMQWIF
ncbi:MAG TPA: DUF4157 domain-containing protein [Bacteroidales bacterium]|nr:DUF4157 domain-containing protein [Bacteroidales bacterium]HPS17446.1 DUF4157 domain-containing protein [Bacteroidales bacterium]